MNKQELREAARAAYANAAITIVPTGKRAVKKEKDWEKIVRSPTKVAVGAPIATNDDAENRSERERETYADAYAASGSRESAMEALSDYRMGR